MKKLFLTGMIAAGILLSSSANSAKSTGHGQNSIPSEHTVVASMGQHVDKDKGTKQRDATPKGISPGSASWEEPPVSEPVLSHQFLSEYEKSAQQAREQLLDSIKLDMLVTEAEPFMHASDECLDPQQTVEIEAVAAEISANLKITESSLI